MQTKICTNCKVSKLLMDFPTDKNYPNGRRAQCRFCRNTYRQTLYRSDKNLQFKDSARAKSRTRYVRNRKIIDDYLSNHPCVDCGEARLPTLDFDHVRGEKKTNIAKLATSASLTTLRLEIEKCEIRCSNCHRMKTAIELGWYSYVSSESS